MSRIQIEMDEEDFRFLTEYNPFREREANRRDLLGVIEEMQIILAEGVMPE